MAGLATSFGSGAMTNSVEEIGDAACILAIGTNTTVAHPVAALQIKRAVKQGAKLIVIDPRHIELCDIADIWLQLKFGTNIPLLMGMCRIILEENLADMDFIQSRCENFGEFKAALEQYPLEKVSQITDVPAGDIVAAARMYATTSPASILYCMGICEYSHGTDAVMGVANLAMVTGNLGKPSAGVNPLRGQNNVQGACDMGALPNVFPGYQAVNDEKNRGKFEKTWSVESLPAEPGIFLTEMFDAIEQGKVKAMYIFGENPVMADPDVNHVKHALEQLEFLVVQDLFLTETAQFADVVLPGASFAEKDGTFTSTERRVQRVRKVVEPIGQSKPDWEIFCLLAKRMGSKGFEFGGPSDIFEEIRKIAPAFAGINYKRLEEGGIQWPCPTEEHPGTKFLHVGTFSRGKGRFAPLFYRPPAELPDDTYPFILTTGRAPFLYHTGMTHRSKGLRELAPYEMAEIHPHDAERLGVKFGDWVQITSRRGSVPVRVKITEDSPEGSVWMSFHYAEANGNVLTNRALDPVTKTPEYKVCAVKMERLREPESDTSQESGEDITTTDEASPETTASDEHVVVG